MASLSTEQQQQEEEQDLSSIMDDSERSRRESGESAIEEESSEDNVSRVICGNGGISDDTDATSEEDFEDFLYPSFADKFIASVPGLGIGSTPALGGLFRLFICDCKKISAESGASVQPRQDCWFWK